MRLNTLYTLFPFVQHTLQDVLQSRPDGTARHQRFPFARQHVMALMSQLVDALAYCHSKSIMHRNLKPKHLLLVLRSPSDSLEYNLDGAHLLVSDFALVRSTCGRERQLTGDVSLRCILESLHFS